MNYKYNDKCSVMNFAFLLTQHSALITYNSAKALGEAAWEIQR